ncbi:(ZYRO0D08866g) [Zygosaccharomyces parabailii]|uniref:ZYBA0S11-00232g1_1 n=1 Tax=Zygosaccharomyces bailii (strain CLIB 213 / ATCC 58445 / CBS 680 / BCRC 21525 / NBRC 1098 / NCYC 1416 / NRRL Y-2227) TaxID=1333698 RepID=A0A8J2T9I3_ZYGB2|nr:(ZYRO0D08866g) [Zygosaccharomyces parabailii]CDF91323.1 ZYBA0S11-00232g1_1 [Zygosaccharomyces bailii CLIB 213]
MPEPILVLSHLEAVHLADSHRDVHVSFDIFSTELQRLETTKLCLPNWNYSCVYPDENCEDHNKYEDEAERLVQQHQQPEQLLPHQQPQQQQRCPHYHRGAAPCNIKCRRIAPIWPSVRRRNASGNLWGAETGCTLLRIRTILCLPRRTITWRVAKTKGSPVPLRGCAGCAKSFNRGGEE